MLFGQVIKIPVNCL